MCRMVALSVGCGIAITILFCVKVFKLTSKDGGYNIDTFIIGHTCFVQCRRWMLSTSYFILLIMSLIWALLGDFFCLHFSVWDFYPPNVAFDYVPLSIEESGTTTL